MDSCHSGTVMDLPYEIRVGETAMRRTTKLNFENLNVQHLNDESTYTHRQKAMRRTSGKPFRESFTSIKPINLDE
jgi:hypothetical protein